MLENGLINVNHGDAFGGTPLLYACWTGIPRLVAKLLSLGADPTATNHDGLNALHASALNGESTVIDLLVRAGVDIEAFGGSPGATPLYMAAHNGNVDVILQLLEAGAKVDKLSTTGKTPLFVACSRGKHLAVRVLLEANANPGVSFVNNSPLEVAVKGGHLEVVREIGQQVGFRSCGKLEAEAALIYAASKQKPDVMNVLFDGGVEDTYGNAICCAVTYGREESVKICLSKFKDSGHDVNDAVDPSGELGPLDCCFMSTSLRLFSCRIVRRLIDAGIDTSLNDPASYALEMTTKYTEDDKVRGLEEMARLFKRVPAIHAVSWGWMCEVKQNKPKKLVTPVRIFRNVTGRNVLRGALSRVKLDS